MLAFAWPWNDDEAAPPDLNAQRLGQSLCAGIGGSASAIDSEGMHFAYRPLQQIRTSPVADWRPAQTGDGGRTIFHGYFDNAEAVADELGVPADDRAKLYASALAAWGDDADLRIIGEYCAVHVDPARSLVRLSRSPLHAPPLIYFHDDHLVAAASVPRALFAAGIEKHVCMAHVADSAMINFTDLEASWFEGLRRVPTGSVVELRRGEARSLRQYYDLGNAPKIRLASGDAYVERARELLDEAVRVTMAGFSKPGSTLSSGLDSPQVAARALANLPPGQNLPTFTFHPESGWDGTSEYATCGDERPAVLAFAAMHPGIEPHFTDNAGSGHDHRWNDMFMAMDGAPSTLPIVYLFHGLFASARKEGCDLLLMAEWGNQTFSDKGQWAYVEYLLTFRWRQLWLALRDFPNDGRSILRRFVALCLIPLLSDRWWKRLMRLWHPKQTLYSELMNPLRADYRESSGANRRLAESGLLYDRYQPRSRAHANTLLFANLDGDSAEIYQAFEQIYGVACRDPTTYRPLVEFCFGSPTDIFVRDGVVRWLAKELGRGMMPEEQRANRLNGSWDADWHLRIGRRREEYLEALDRIEADEELGAMIDVQRLRAALNAFPERNVTDMRQYLPIKTALINGLLTARFVNYVKGRN